MTDDRSAGDPDEATHVLDGSFRLVVVLAVVGGLLLGLSVVRGALGPDPGSAGASASIASSASPTPSVATDAYLVRPVRAAPELTLTDQDGRPFDLASSRADATLVFFGYTHCPDVCPATIGTMGLAMTEVGGDVRAVFVTIDPARDTVAWLDEYVRFLPAGFSGLTGNEGAVARTAAAWGVKYAKVDTDVPDGYAMSHTADVFVIDAAGDLRARIPFGTDARSMAAMIRMVVATPVAIASGPATSTPRPTVAPAGGGIGLSVGVVSSSIWSGPASPVILTLSAGGTDIDDRSIHPTVQLQDSDGVATGPPVSADPVSPPGVERVFYVANVAVPMPGAWQLAVTAVTGLGSASGTAVISVLDPGTTPAIGSRAPIARTPTLDDVGGVARAVTTDPAPDLRLSRTSTSDALTAHRPFVLVIDSTRFRVSPACGRAIVMARYLQDRWPDVPFIHHEPYVYDVVTDTAVLRGSLEDPILTDPAAAWGIGGSPWGARSMPWVFVVDGQGMVRAAFQGVVGSPEVDVIVSLIEAAG